MLFSTREITPTGICLLGVVCYAVWYVPAPSILATFSYLWIARLTYSGKQYWVLRNLHKKYGLLVQTGPNEVLTDDPEIIKKISSTTSTYHKAKWYLNGRFNPYHDSLFTILEPKAHKKAKARSMSAYNGRETPGVELGINEQVEKLIHIIHERYLAPLPGQSQPLLDLGLISCYFTMDVITRLAFGKATGDLEDEQDHYGFLGSLRRLWPQISTSADVPWIGNIIFSSPVLNLVGPKTTDKTGLGALMGVAERYVNQRFDSDEKHDGDMLASLMRHGFNRTECQVEGLLMLMAGTESTACAIRGILVHIITSPLAYARLKKEVSATVEKNMVSYPISWEEAKKLSYLQAVIYEGLRMRPPLLGEFPKEVPPEGDSFHGMFIPGGTSICMNLSSLLYSPSLFGADAAVFRPERFTEVDPMDRRDMELNVELAFGYWMCAGKAIALMELNKVIFELFRHLIFSW